MSETEKSVQRLSAQQKAGRSSALLWTAVTGVFVSVSLLSVPVPGINEPHYLSKARAFADASWCAGDFFLQSANAHYVFFAVTAPLTKWLPLAVVAVIGRVVSLSVLAAGWTMLGRRLALSPTAVLLAALTFCLIAMMGNLSGEWVIGGYEGKVPAYGFALIGTSLWLDARRIRRVSAYTLSGTFFGAAVSFHPVVGIWFCVGVAFSELYFHILEHVSQSAATTRRMRTWKQFWIHGLTFTFSSLLLALPGLIPAASMILSSDLPTDSIDRANYIQIFWRLSHHLDPSTFPRSAWIHTSVVLIILVITLIVARQLRLRRSPETADADGEISAWHSLLALLIVAGAITGAGVYVGWHSVPVLKLPDWQWRADVLKFYPFRFLDALLPMTSACAVALLFDAVTLRWRSIMRAVLVCLVAISAVIMAQGIRPTAPPGYAADTFESWQDACEWIRRNTPEDALIFGPREGFGLNWFAERAQYVCFKDCPQDSKGILQWNDRLWTIHHWSRDAYKDSVFDRTDTKQLNEETEIDYILTRQLAPFEQDPVYQSDVWRVYQCIPKAD